MDHSLIIDRVLSRQALNAPSLSAGRSSVPQFEITNTKFMKKYVLSIPHAAFL